MDSFLSASTIKSWFQYRCERKTRYDMMTRAQRDSATIAKVESSGAWAIAGDRFERLIIDRLKKSGDLLAPAPGQDRLGQAETLAFLRGETRYRAATQLGLEATPALRERLGLPDTLKINRSYADLVFREQTADGVVLKIIDIKATRNSTPFHKSQVAFYALLLGGMLAEIGSTDRVDAEGEIWIIADGTGVDEGREKPDPFLLKPYLRIVEDFLTREAPSIAKKRVFKALDETAFHIYFKCEQCDYLPHCRGAIERAPPETNDVSAVPGISQQGKAALRARGVTTVQALAKSSGIGAPGMASWSLQRNGEQVIARARALAGQSIFRLDDALTYLMPDKIDRAFYLSADHDAVEDSLAAIGYMRRGGAPREVIRVIADPASERRAIIDVLEALIADLTEVDCFNQAAPPEQQIRAHIFVYEAAEARALQSAIKRHIDDPTIRAGLLHAVRLFPPDDVVPEPEFKGIHHLPATAIRSVLEQIYALPVKVSYDLRQVSQALHDAKLIDAAYAPDAAFKRDFSSLLAMDVIRAMRDTRRKQITLEEVELDVRARLNVSAQIVEWLITENDHAAIPFLRLAKQPFRFQSTLNPLAASDLDLLNAYEVLESRSALLEALVRLSKPARVRQQRGDCLAHLTLLDANAKWGNRPALRFQIPPESLDAEVSSDDIGLILTDDNPDNRLDIRRWRDLQVTIRYGEGRTVNAIMSKDQRGSARVQTLIRNTAPGGWFIDKSHRDINGPRVQSFLQSLSEQK